MTDIIKEQKTIARGAFWSIFGTTAVKGISFVYTVLIAYFITQEQIGDFYLALSILGLLVVFSNLGMGKSFGRYVPFFYGKKQFKELKILLKFGFSIGLLISLVLSAAVFLLAEFIAGFFNNPNLIPLLRLMAIYPFINAVFILCNAFLTGRKRIDYVRTSTIIQDFSKLLFTFLFFYLIGFDFYSLAYALVLSFIIGIIYALFRVYGEINKLNFGTISETKTDYVNIGKEVLPFGIVIGVITSMWMIISYSDRLMLGYLMPIEIASTQIAIYSISIGLGKLTKIFTVSIGVIFFPVISELFGKNDIKKIERISSTAIKWLLLISIPITMLLVLFSSNFLDLFYGADYVDGSAVLIFFSVGLLIRGIGTVPGLVLATMRRLDIEFKIMAFAVIVNILLNLLLIPTYGITGAAFASFCSFILLTVLLIYYAGKIAGFRFPTESYKPLLAGLLAFSLIFLLKPYLWPVLDETVSNFLLIGIGQGGAFEEILQKVVKLTIFGTLFLLCCAVYFLILLASKLFGEDEIKILDAVLRKGKVPEKYREQVIAVLEAKYIPKFSFFKEN